LPEQFKNKRTPEGLSSVVKTYMEAGETPFDLITGTIKTNKAKIVSDDVQISAPFGTGKSNVLLDLADWKTDINTSFSLSQPEKIPAFSWGLKGSLETPKISYDIKELEKYFQNLKVQDEIAAKEKAIAQEKERRKKIQGLNSLIEEQKNAIRGYILEVKKEKGEIKDKIAEKYSAALEKEKTNVIGLLQSVEKILAKKQVVDADIKSVEELVGKAKGLEKFAKKDKEEAVRALKIWKLENNADKVNPFIEAVTKIYNQQQDKIFESRKFLMSLHGTGYQLPKEVDEALEEIMGLERKIEGMEMKAMQLVQVSIPLEDVEKISANIEKIKLVVKEAKGYFDKAKDYEQRIDGIIKKTQETSKADSERIKKMEAEIAAQKKKIAEERRRAEEARKKAEEERRKAEALAREAAEEAELEAEEKGEFEEFKEPEAKQGELSKDSKDAQNLDEEYEEEEGEEFEKEDAPALPENSEPALEDGVILLDNQGLSDKPIDIDAPTNDGVLIKKVGEEEGAKATEKEAPEEDDGMVIKRLY
jgi:hypothetical protein